MGMKLKKLWPLFGVMSMGLLAPACADQCQHSGGPQSMASTQQTDQGAYQREMSRGVTPAAGPVVANGVNLFFRVEPLYWRVVPDAFSYAVHGFKTSETTSSVYQSAPSGRAEFIDSKWKLGFQAGLGMSLGHDGWDTSLRFAYLRPKGKGRLPATQGDLITPFVINPGGRIITPPGEDGGGGDWRLQFYTLDLELGRNSALGSFLNVRPHIGMKTTWQKEEREVTYRSKEFHLLWEASEGQQHSPVTGPYHLSQDYDVWGIGLRCGCDFSWFFCRDFGLYGNFSWAVLWTDYYNQHRVDTLHDTDTDTIVIDFNNAHYYAAKNLCEFECGLLWEAWLCDDDYHFEARLGCEGQVWVNWIRNLALSNTLFSNLSCYGPKATLRFDF